MDFVYYTKAMTKRRKKIGRPATGHDRVVPIRLPAKLLTDIDAWTAVYRNEHELVGMTRSAGIRCLILLGLERALTRVIDPKNQTTFEGATLPFLEFYSRTKIGKLLAEGTARKAKPKPVAPFRSGERIPSEASVQAAADRAERRSKTQS